MHRLLERQVKRSTTPDGRVDWGRVSDLVSNTYAHYDSDRQRSDRATQLMLNELDEINRSRDDVLSRLKGERDKLDAALGNMTHALAMFDADGVLLVCNARYVEMFSLYDVRPGTKHSDILTEIKRQLATTDIPAERLHGLFGRTKERVELSLADGRWIAATCSPMKCGGWVEVFADVTEQRRAADHVRFLARHDPLTGLPNRHAFNEVITRECERSNRGASVAILCLDLDHFKGVNDTLGHPIGDQLLCEVANRLRRNVRIVDSIVRLGGDEFAIVQVDAEQPRGSSLLARRVIDELSKPYIVDGHQIVIGTSVGIAVLPQDGDEANIAIRNADMALYRAKADGRGVYRYFEPGMDTAIQARRKMELDLRAAMKAGQFELHYQPLVDIDSDKLSACEALLRWNHPAQGRVPPDQFIPLAEEIGLINEIGEWVLNEACRTATTWAQDVCVAVNISPVQFKSPQLLDTIKAALNVSRLKPERLELEITETILLQETDRTLAVLHELRNLGVRIAMDDFGTGYSSLSYLRKFPFDKLKIDRSFINDLGAAGEANAIVRAVTELASTLGMRTTAEGVETVEQHEALKALRCSEIQGYLISRPLSSSDLSALMAGELAVEKAA